MQREYASDTILVTFEPRRCIHSARCLQSLPKVFNIDKTPWVQPENGTADQIAGAIVKCPTGALHFERLDGGQAEIPDVQTTIEVRPNGPLFLRGQLLIRNPGGDVIREDTRVALCRCGNSSNKPFCDGSHARIQFEADPADTDPL